MANFDFTESQLQEFDDWSESIDLDCLDAIENSIEDLQVEPHAKRRRTSSEPEPSAQGNVNCRFQRKLGEFLEFSSKNF